MKPTIQNSSKQSKHSAELSRYQREVAGLKRALQALSKCNQALVGASNESELLNLICETVVQVAGYRMAWVGFPQNDQDRSVCVVAQAGFEEGYLQTMKITWADTERGRGPVGTAIRTGKICVVKDVLKEPSFQLWRGEASKRGYASVIALPLAEGGHRLGSLAIYASEPDAFDEAEVQLLTELANSLAYGIIALRSEFERKRAQAELSRTLAWRQALFNASRDAIFITDSGSNFVDVNPSACELLGYSRQELLQMRISDPQQNIRLDSYPTYKDLVAGERLLTVGIVLRKDGASLDVEASVSGVEIEGKLYIRTAVRDISERRQAEDALRQAEEKYRGIFEENIVGISQSTTDGCLLSVNPAFARMFGYDSPEEMVARITAVKQQIYVDPSRREEFERLMQKHGTVEAFEYQGYRKDGSKIWLRGNARAVCDSSGAVLHYIGATEEIT